MKLKLSFLFILCGIVNLIPMSASAFTFEDLTEAMKSRRSCPVVEDLPERE